VKGIGWKIYYIGSETRDPKTTDNLRKKATLLTHVSPCRLVEETFSEKSRGRVMVVWRFKYRTILSVHSSHVTVQNSFPCLFSFL